MAIGDVVAGVSSIAAGASLVFQPAAGVEVIIMEIATADVLGTEPNLYLNMNARVSNGTIVSTFFNKGVSRTLKVCINNSIYLDLSNLSASTQVLGYTGIQTK